jgi:hypothetical protein
MPEPIIDIFQENIQKEPRVEKKTDIVLPKPSSIMSDMRSMNSRIDEKLENENENISKTKSSKSASTSIKQQEQPQIKNITITQPNDTHNLSQTRQPNLKKKTDTSLNTQAPPSTGGGNPKYSFF